MISSRSSESDESNSWSSSDDVSTSKNTNRSPQIVLSYSNSYKITNSNNESITSKSIEMSSSMELICF